MHGQLRAGMKLEPREVLARELIDAQVLDNQGIDADLIQGGERCNQFRQLILADDGIDGHEDAPPRLEAVSVGGDFVDFLEREIFRLRARRELLQAEINSVRAEMERSVRGLGPAGRRQQLDRMRRFSLPQARHFR